MDSAQEVTTSTAPAPAQRARPAGSGTKSIFNSDRGNWTEDPD
jgi:hypothetical protein